MGKDPLNDGRVIDRGDELHPPCTARTAQDIQVQGPAHPRGPGPVAWPSLGARVPQPAADSHFTRLYRLGPFGATIEEAPTKPNTCAWISPVFIPPIPRSFCVYEDVWTLWSTNVS